MITDRNGIISALGNNYRTIVIDKPSVASQLAGVFCSLWRATGTPGQGAIPTTAALCTSALTGAIPFTNQTAPAKAYIGTLHTVSSLAPATVEFHDRIAHCGGLLLNSIALQTISGLDLNTLSAPADRVGSADFSDLQWWLEVYSAGGATASNATINVTFNDNSTGNLSVIAVGGTIAASRMYDITSLRTTAQQGLFIRGINSVTLSASTTVAGNFGFTCTRRICTVPMISGANAPQFADWAALGFPKIPNDACVVPLVLTNTTSSGTLRGGGKYVYG